MYSTSTPADSSWSPLHITLQAFGRRSYPERRTTKYITITRNKCVQKP
uniref:Uncharacterized protein n=1 Tax=Anguilla anguilla TaxID=7936 RepID=A0A0E9Q7Q6_ANGAN